MDLGLYASVLWRFRWLVFIGTLLAVVLTVLSVAKMTSSGLEYRQPETWQAESQLLLTQPGFPEGRALFPNPETQRSKYSYADAARFASLTALYSQFAQSDEVNALVRSEGAPTRIVGLRSATRSTRLECIHVAARHLTLRQRQIAK